MKKIVLALAALFPFLASADVPSLIPIPSVTDAVTEIASGTAPIVQSLLPFVYLLLSIGVPIAAFALLFTLLFRR